MTPLLLTYDIEAAFPPVAHEKLFAVLEWLMCPSGLILMQFLLRLKGVLILLSMCFLGLLQDCPLSASLFVIALGPILRRMEDTMHRTSLGIIRAWADDLGGVVIDTSTLLFFKQSV